jgi:hypothetical protein
VGYDWEKVSRYGCVMSDGAGGEAMVTMEQDGRKRRRDAGQMKLMDRDLRALAWIGAQWTVRVDHLQRVLGRSTDNLYSDLSPAATREVVSRRYWRTSL